MDKLNWVERWIMKTVIARVAVALVKWLDGKKTLIGAINMLLWIVLYALPAFTPEYNWVTVYAAQIRDALQSAGLNLDNELFNTGVGFTVVGLIDKFRKLFSKTK